ncbi:hypothetical protein AC579_5997 [Pseudocercospora musae]|uniref:Uncharacterized protein n=1 Tax=Pseudocercospora musae TaxID=113226 RepID=A0A139I0Y5_9PEZI|nr:hypothetical protein AC579_5997 [Pseudocercospora musae]
MLSTTLQQPLRILNKRLSSLLWIIQIPLSHNRTFDQNLSHGTNRHQNFMIIRVHNPNTSPIPRPKASMLRMTSSSRIRPTEGVRPA